MRQDGRIGWVQGEQFTDGGNFLAIRVDSMTPTSATITIDPRFVNAAGPGEVCGNKYVGELRLCAPGTTCSQRRTGQLVSVDHYCD
jgi:hypothetical protein